MKIAIIGSRNFKNMDLIAKVIGNIRFSGAAEITIISGGASGVDTEAIEIAKSVKLKTEEYKPDMSAGYDVAQYHIRNDKIIAEADKVIAFWDGKSRGTRSVIEKCLQRRKNVEVIFE